MKQIDDKKEPNIIIERPRICCIDLKEEFVSMLKDSGANVYNGTLGSKVRVQNTSYDNEGHKLLLNNFFPSNFHEFDIFIIDLAYFETIDFEYNEHIREEHTGKTEQFFLSSFPETVFDPRPFSTTILKKLFAQIYNRKYLTIVFSSKSYDNDYQLVSISNNRIEKGGVNNYNIYDFWTDMPIASSKYGEEITICKSHPELQFFLERHKDGVFYNQTFKHPTHIEDNYGNGFFEILEVKNNTFIPLMTSINNDIVSFFDVKNNLIVLPQIKDKGKFLIDFLSNVATDLYPELFPYSTTFSWKNEQEYWLPNHSILLKNKSDIQQEYEEKLLKGENDIIENLENFSFLHELLTETGDALVKSVIIFLKWLEFKNVKDFDEVETNSNILEEDIQVELSVGLLIIECKGIGGTSKDSDCSQISKIKFRRCEERGKFDVYALYIVNHQRHLPPLKRQNPPFQENQLKDAVNEKRGLLTTWQLYNLYFDVKDGIITKEEARLSLLGYGLIEFKPKDIVKIYEPTEFFKNDTVCIINVENFSLSVNDELYVEHNGRFELMKILGIKQNDISVQQASNGELGLELSSKIKKKSFLWKRI